MKFLAALFGKQKQQTSELREMEGQLHSFPDVEVIVLAHVADDDRHPFPEKKKELYFEAFANEPFIFDGEVRSLMVTNAYVKRDLSGSLNAYLYSQTAQEVITEHTDFGEYPNPVGDLYLHLVDGILPCIKVSRWRDGAGWSNDNYKAHYQRG